MKSQAEYIPTVSWLRVSWASVVVVCAALFSAASCRPQARDVDNEVVVSRADSENARRVMLKRASESSFWPGWRGIGASGISQDVQLPEHWSQYEGHVWKTDVPGVGHSSPIVWGDRIFLTTHLPTGMLTLLAFDRIDGHRLWTTETEIARGPTHAENGYASATPVTDGERIFVSFGSSGLFCFDMSGNRMWQVSLGELRQRWGSASSPVLFGNLVIQLADSASGSFLLALNKYTGREVWRTRREGDGCWSTPILVTPTGNKPDSDGSNREETRSPELVVNGTGPPDGSRGRITAYDPVTGQQLWYLNGTTDVVCPTPIADGSRVICTSGPGGPILVLSSGGEGDARDRIVWKKSSGGPHVSTGLVYQGRLILARKNGHLACYRAEDGRLLWDRRLRGSFSASLVAGDGKIYATSENGTVYVVKSADKFQLIAENRMQQRCSATPAISQGKIYLRTDRQLIAISGSRRSFARSTGEEKEIPSDSGSLESPFISETAP